MRTVKFRGWNTKSRRWDYFDLQDLITGGASDEEYSKKRWCGFTGLLDKKGKEIYEGDIVKYGVRVSKVVWDKNEAGFMCQVISQDERKYPVEGKIEPIFLPLEIIGNVYEDKNLLTPKLCPTK